MTKYNNEYGWARKREQVNNLVAALIGDLRVGETLEYPWLKKNVRESVGLKNGFEANSLHAMVYIQAKKFIATGCYELRERKEGDGKIVKGIIRIK